MRIYIRLAVLLLSLIFLIGIVTYPEWWTGFLFGGGFRDLSSWRDDGLDALQQVAIAVVVFAALLGLLHVLRIFRLQELRSLLQLVVTSPIADRSVTFLTLGVFVAIAAIVGTMVDRAIPARKIVTGGYSITVNDPGLTPTTFLYIDNDAVEKLSGQYEPDLVPETVVAEIKSSSDIKAGVSVEDFLKTEVGQSEFQRKMTEYKKVAQSPGRKLKDLLPYLAQHQIMRRFWGTIRDPPEITRLDQAELTLQGQGIAVDRKQLAAARERLLAEQLRKLEDELKDLQGLVLIEGAWSVEARGDRYVFTKPFVENVTHSSLAEFTVKKSDLAAGYEAIIDRNRGKTLHLRLFGNILVGTSDAGTILIEPEGLFL